MIDLQHQIGPCGGKYVSARHVAMEKKCQVAMMCNLLKTMRTSFYMKMTSIELLGYSAALCFSSIIASQELHSETLELVNPLLFIVALGSALTCLYPRTKKLASRFTRG